jgi:NADPH2:quinone reductase
MQAIHDEERLMRIWRFHEFGDIDNLRLDEIPTPEPPPGEALVRVQFAALNPADRYLIKKQYPRPGKPPLAVGRDGSGTIEKVHPGSRFKVGDKVIVLRSETGVSRDGTLGEFVCVPEVSLAPVPSGWSMEEGAAGPLVFLTAWRALVIQGQLKAGETVLVTGASGGVGTASIALAKALGAKVVALSRGTSKRDALMQLGADIVVDASASDVEDQVKKALDGGRVDLVVENVAGPFLQKCVNMCGEKGRIYIVGLLAGLTAEVVVGLLIFKQIRIEGVVVSGYRPEESQAAWSEILKSLSKTGKRPLIDRVFPMNDLLPAFGRLAEGPLGKVLIKMGS